MAKEKFLGGNLTEANKSPEGIFQRATVEIYEKKVPGRTVKNTINFHICFAWKISTTDSEVFSAGNAQRFFRDALREADVPKASPKKEIRKDFDRNV